MIIRITCSIIQEFSTRGCHYDLDASGHVVVTQGREVLPSDVKFTNCVLDVEPDFEKFTVDGKVARDLDVLEDSTIVAINSLDIDIKEVELKHEGNIQKLTETSYDKDIQTVTFKFKDTIPAGSKVTLTIQYVGDLNDNMARFDRSSYKDQDRKTRYLATTQMEPTDTRRALPCFDQPELKATWEVTLIADQKLTCLSNMDVREEKILSNGKKLVAFNKSPPMSSYTELNAQWDKIYVRRLKPDAAWEIMSRRLGRGTSEEQGLAKDGMELEAYCDVPYAM
ncbi:Aminopeptidase 2 mitochondrial [Rhizina undulata]